MPPFYFWQLIVHIILLITSTWKAYLLNSLFEPASRALKNNYLELILPESLEHDEFGEVTIFEMEEAVEVTHEILTNYYELPTKSISRLEIASFSNLNLTSWPILHVMNGTSQTEKQYVLYDDENVEWPIGLENNSTTLEIRWFFDHLEFMKLHLWIISYPYNREDIQILWKLLIMFDFSSQDQLTVSHETVRLSSIEKYSTHYPQNLWIDLCILFFSVLNEILLVYPCCRSFLVSTFSQASCVHLFKKKKKHDAQDSKLEKVTHELNYFECFPLILSFLPVHFYRSDENFQFQILVVFLEPLIPPTATENNSYACAISRYEPCLEEMNGWALVQSTSNILLFLCSIQAVFANKKETNGNLGALLFGLGCATLWISSLSFFRYNARHSAFVLTIRKALPKIVEFLIGCLPIFIGYVIFGTVVFGNESARFDTLGTTSTTLFAVVNGDEIRDTFLELASYPWTSQIFIYTYIVMFTYVVLMVCIAIVEESFFVTTIGSPRRSRNRINKNTNKDSIEYREENRDSIMNEDMVNRTTELKKQSVAIPNWEKFWDEFCKVMNDEILLEIQEWNCDDQEKMFNIQAKVLMRIETQLRLKAQAGKHPFEEQQFHT